MHSKTNPFIAKIKERFLLNKPGSTKRTFHISLDLGQDHFPFQVGDSIAVLPMNDPALIEKILRYFHATGEESIFDTRSNRTLSLREILLFKANLAKCTSSLLKLLRERGASGLEEFLIPENKHLLTELLATHQLIDLLHLFPAPITPQELCAILLPLMPRFYSIASSPKVFPQEIHLTVAFLTYPVLGGTRQGVGSHFLCEYAQPQETSIPIYLQPSNGFTLPADPEAPIILIGPGTGIAPFRAFLQERLALQHKGRNWLIFGERNRATDFYYSDYWLELERQQRLRLSLAFSRDTAEKTYVQHRLWEERETLWKWLQEGAYLYVCGDAEKMAKDVDLTLQRIARECGHLPEDKAREYLKSLRHSRHYLQDVY
ncbi:MAG: sulfite reductase [Verrucomicrobiota bacterium]|nr:sulfite reductase [Verrucomicrobiota bacterium]